jgi:hypothetical protein
VKTYNRALDYTVLALTELKAGNGELAARLMAKAVEQTDLTAAIATLEASNKHAFALQAAAKQEASKKAAPAKTEAGAKKRLQANDEFPFTDDVVDGEDGGMEEAAMEDEAFGESDDPLAEVDDGMEEAPGETMAKVLSSMVRKAGRK